MILTKPLEFKCQIRYEYDFGSHRLDPEFNSHVYPIHIFSTQGKNLQQSQNKWRRQQGRSVAQPFSLKCCLWSKTILHIFSPLRAIFFDKKVCGIHIVDIKCCPPDYQHYLPTNPNVFKWYVLDIIAFASCQARLVFDSSSFSFKIDGLSFPCSCPSSLRYSMAVRSTTCVKGTSWQRINQ